MNCATLPASHPTPRPMLTTDFTCEYDAFSSSSAIQEAVRTGLEHHAV